MPSRVHSLRMPFGQVLVAALVLGCLQLAVISCAWALTEATRWHRAGGAWRELPLDLAVTALAAAVLSGCAAWLALVAALTVVEAVTGRSSSVAHRLTPSVVRRLVATSLGLALTGAPLAAATAVEAERCGTRGGGGCLGGVSGLPLPDRAVGGRPPASPIVTPAALATVAATHTPPSYVVERGDSLWRIAERRLPGGSSAADVDATWRRIYRLNRAQVGEDPDVLTPGLRLRLPALDDSALTGRPDGAGPTRKDQS